MGNSPDGAIAIRRAEPADFEGVASVYEGPTAQSGTMQVPFPSREVWRKRLAEPPAGAHILVALMDGRIVGNGGLLPAESSPRRAHVMHLGLAVHDDYQSRGVGKALMAALVDLADRWLPVRRLELQVYADNARAIALYERFGFREEGRHRGHTLRDGAYVDTVSMARVRPK